MVIWDAAASQANIAVGISSARLTGNFFYVWQLGASSASLFFSGGRRWCSLGLEKVSLESECLPWPHFWSWPKWPHIEQRPAHYTTMSHRPQ